ncbi:MAG: hypothetical protein KGL39_30515 [Patescibacteria group bacterium]|nr:hypothetical protein [Patescibacteria group bacterium]
MTDLEIEALAHRAVTRQTNVRTRGATYEATVLATDLEIDSAFREKLGREIYAEISFATTIPTQASLLRLMKG